MAATEPRNRLALSLRCAWTGVLALAAVALGLVGFVLGERHEASREATLPVLGTAPSYTMTDQLGETVSSASFRGKVELVTFLFPYCTTLCPLIAAHLADLERLGLGPAGIADKVEIVSFDIDPEHTGPRQMRAFLRQYGWNPEDRHWQYLVGSPAEMRRVASTGFGVWYKRVSLASEAGSGSGAPSDVEPEIVNKLAEQSRADYDIVHNDVLEIVDQQGRIRRIYDNADTVGWQDLLARVRSLVGSAR